jgi:hypothetical protein
LLLTGGEILEGKQRVPPPAVGMRLLLLVLVLVLGLFLFLFPGHIRVWGIHEHQIGVVCGFAESID